MLHIKERHLFNKFKLPENNPEQESPVSQQEAYRLGCSESNPGSAWEVPPYGLFPLTSDFSFPILIPSDSGFQVKCRKWHTDPILISERNGCSTHSDFYWNRNRKLKIGRAVG